MEDILLVYSIIPVLAPNAGVAGGGPRVGSMQTYSDRLLVGVIERLILPRGRSELYGKKCPGYSRNPPRLNHGNKD